MSYLGVPPFGQTVRTITELTAAAGQTTFNIAGGYLPGYVDVFLNGVNLASSDLTASNGSTVVLGVAASLNDEFKAIAYWPVSLTDTYRKGEVDSAVAGKVNKTGDTMTGSYNFGGFISLQTADAGGYPRINGNASSAQLGLFRSSGGSEGGFYVGGDAGQFSVWSSDFVRRLNVDTSGRVTMPYQPAFFAYSSSGHISGTGHAVFGATRLNRGGYYSTSNGRFTAPVAGVYFFTAQGLPLSTVNYPFMRIWKNGSAYSADTYVINADESVSISCAIEMAANDYVTVYYIDGSEGGYSHFSGFLVG